VIKALRTFRVHPSLPPELTPLTELSHNLRWAWHRPTRELFRWVDPDLWNTTGKNPVALLGRLSAERIEALRGDGAFRTELSRIHRDLQQYLTADRWAQTHPGGVPQVAYFSPEFGLSHAMQTYSGGLGVLAGDHLKAASDLGLEMVGVGLLYRHGYFRQFLDTDGWQREEYPDLNPHGLPLSRMERDGQPTTVEVLLGDRMVACQVWRAQVGRVPLLLLDTDLPGNHPHDRSVTDRLYGGDNEHRLRQEIVLGIGGVRALRLAVEAGELDVRPDVFHSNEGHAGFLQLERIRELVGEGLSFDEAIEAARASVLFTTHTPVPAGIDKFPRELMNRYFTDFATTCGIGMERLMTIGQVDPEPGAEFNMAVMGLRLSAAANGVSKLHGTVARSMFAALWPDLAPDEVPISSITNGVHAPTWIGREMTAVYDRHLSPDWAHNPDAWARAGEIGDDELWRARGRARERLVANVRGWVRAQRERRGEPSGQLGWTDEIFDPEALTIGFARRFAEYKRGTLLLSQPDRLRALLTSADRPVQLVFSGKAHPRDDFGKDLIRQIVHYSADPALRTRIVFVEDYDMDIARILLQGVDVWLNNPRRPHEACGTSGQKAVLNGGIHCSTLDGWWDEMFDGDNGFAIGSPTEFDDTGQQDAADAQSLFDLLERVLVPTFYDRVEGPLPRRWLAMVRRSITTLGAPVLASRMVQEYATDLYVPVAARSRRLVASDRAPARELAAWRARVVRAWPGVSVVRVDAEEGVGSIGDHRDVRVVVDSGELTAEDLQAELLHGPVDADGAMRDVTVERMLDGGAGSDGTVEYHGRMRTGAAGEYGFAVRVVPAHEHLASPHELGLATWAG
jgi:glycogen phosphorylase